MTYSQIGRTLTDEMVTFWNTLYSNVLLEYMYINKLDWDVPKLTVIRNENCAVEQMDTYNLNVNENNGKWSNERVDSSFTSNNNCYLQGSSTNNEIASNESEWHSCHLHSSYRYSIYCIEISK